MSTILHKVVFVPLIILLPVLSYAQEEKDWGSYPDNYREIAWEWIRENVDQPDSARDVVISTPGKWWQRASIFKGGETVYGYRVMVTFTPKKKRGGYDDPEFHNLHIRNGVLVDSWKDKQKVAVRAETDDILVRDLAITAGRISLDTNLDDLPYTWVLLAQLKKAGVYHGTVTTTLDKTISATFRCVGPGPVYQAFFPRKEFSKLWHKPGDERQWYPFHFLFEDSLTQTSFELDQWAYIIEDGLDELRDLVKKAQKELRDAPKLTETIDVGFDGREWKAGYTNTSPREVITEYVLPGETVENWTELVTVQSFPGRQEKMTPEELMQGMKDGIIKDCPSAMWNVIQKETNEIVYEWQTTVCPGLDIQHEIVKMIKGKEAMHRIAYTTKKLPLSETDRIDWVNLITAAKTKGGN